jgi:hypothetical protein
MLKYLRKYPSSSNLLLILSLPNIYIQEPSVPCRLYTILRVSCFLIIRTSKRPRNPAIPAIFKRPFSTPIHFPILLNSSWFLGNSDEYPEDYSLLILFTPPFHETSLTHPPNLSQKSYSAFYKTPPYGGY